VLNVLIGHSIKSISAVQITTGHKKDLFQLILDYENRWKSYA